MLRYIAVMGIGVVIGIALMAVLAVLIHDRRQE